MSDHTQSFPGHGVTRGQNESVATGRSNHWMLGSVGCMCVCMSVVRESMCVCGVYVYECVM